MVYKVIGLMSGSSLDGLDIAHVQLEEIRGKWSYQLLHTDCIPYTAEWTQQLQQAHSMPVADFLRLHTAYGRYLGAQVAAFINDKGIHHQVHFIASHGHTVFHEPGSNTTFQLGEGAAIAATAGLPVINDLRALDVAFGGQGAPIVPIGDKLLFGEYDYLLNIGGIANMTILKEGTPMACDICPANQMLNVLAQRQGQDMDEDGAIAARGGLLPGLLDELGSHAYYALPAPKSLSNVQATDMVFPTLLASDYDNASLLHTATQHIARQVAATVAAYPHGRDNAQLLVTGGGAFNSFLVGSIQDALAGMNVTVTVPARDVVMYKEALVMALIGTLRWREDENVMSSVTGASRDSCGGALWVV